ncbi:uncharacterized protein LOC113388394 [Ctenocephalides felis]|uniref:uncharacterized protein LOC113388394 n=1 Tax=Ctenocephalides felis TaxID=7515 RepID=UPI000E6E2A28|nr:uncharacterized protein LOC113388394 [Ctenocephalides felis]
MAKVIFRNGKQSPPDQKEFDSFNKNNRLKKPFEMQPFKMNDLTDEYKKNSTASEISPADNSFNQIYGNNTCEPFKEMLEDVKRDFLKFRPFYNTRDTLGNNLDLKQPDNPYLRLSHDSHPIKPQHMWKMYEYYQALRFGGKDLPNWLTESMMLDMEESNKLLMQFLFKYAYARKLSAGSYTNSILEEFKKIKKNSKQNGQHHLQLLCADELIVAAVIATLTYPESNICGNKFDMIVPKHGTAIIVELHERQKQHYVKVLHWNSNADEPKEIKNNSCKNGCTLENFEKMLKDATTSDYEYLDGCGKPID